MDTSGRDWFCFLELIGAIKPQWYFGGASGPGTPLIDWLVQNQTLRFAITAPTNTDYFENKYKDRKDPFRELPTGLESIEKGSVLTTWFAIEAYSNSAPGKEWGGGLFTHGVYFAHGIELITVDKELVARLRNSIYKPTGDVTRWERPEKFPG